MKKPGPAIGWIVILLTLILAGSCKKEKQLPEITTSPVSQVYLDSLLGGGNVLSEGASPVIERGVCWSLGQNPTIEDKRTSDGSGTGEYSSYITGFETNSTYFFRAYATNAEGTAYGEQVSFQVNPMYPEIKTEVTQLTSSGATISVSLTCDNALNIYASGIVYGTKPELDYNKDIVQLYTGEGKSFSLELEHLTPATLYYYKPFVIFRLSGTTNIYIIYGEPLFFKIGGLPTVKTLSVTSITDTSAIVSAEVLSTIVSSRGICLAMGHTPTINDIIVTSPGDPGIFSCKFINLGTDKIYSARAFASGEEGISYGSELSFNTYSRTVTDISGNIYHVIKIGNQFWMQENLQTWKLNDNTEIPIITSDTEWRTTTAPAASWYQNNSAIRNALLYNRIAVNTSKLCPIGWHVPSESETRVLINYVNNSVATLQDSHGFKAVFDGKRDSDGQFWGSGNTGYWWGTNFVLEVFSSFIFFTNSEINCGLSVRCLKN